MTTKTVTLQYNDLAHGGRSDKEYRIWIEKVADECPGFRVRFEFGRRGGTLQHGSKTPEPISFAAAEKIFEKLLAEKLGKGYQEVSSSTDTQASKVVPIRTAATRTTHPVELLTEVTNTQAVLELVADRAYWLQEKRDGHRRQIFGREHGEYVIGFNRKGEAVELPAKLKKVFAFTAPSSFLLDGELEGDRFTAFDLLMADGKPCGLQTYRARYVQLVDMISATKLGCPRDLCPLLEVVRTWDTAEGKAKAMIELEAARAEGVVFKLAAAPYQAGRNGQHKKFKFVKTLSAIVTAVRPEGKESITVAVRDRLGIRTVVAGKDLGPLKEVANCSVIGKKVPELGDVVEVRYLYATEARRLVQAIYLRIRTDVTAKECTMDQLRFKQGVER